MSRRSLKSSIFSGLFLSVILSHSAMGQLTFGIGAGMNYSGLSEVSFDNAKALYTSRTGYHFGVFIDMAGGPFAFRPGLYYLDVGPLFQDGLGGILEVQDQFQLSFVAVPVDVRLRVPFRTVKPYVHFGPELRFLSGNAPDEGSLEGNLRPFNISGNIGGGFEFSLGAITILPELRFALDLSGLTSTSFDIEGTVFEASEEHKSRSVLLRLGAAF